MPRTWEITDVVDVDGPAAVCRAYWEFRDLRDVLAGVARGRTLDHIYDVGCGYGRLLNLLGEFAGSVTGFEREPGLIAHARKLVRGANVVQVEALSSLPASDHTADLVVCFTVLQHFTDSELTAAAAEIARVLKPSGSLVLVEETDETLEAGDADHADLGYTKGRSVAHYADAFAPRRLVHTQPRRIEPTYPRPNVGTYMVFSA
jgi:SAM-dependent methyltransferase